MNTVDRIVVEEQQAVARDVGGMVGRSQLFDEEDRRMFVMRPGRESPAASERTTTDFEGLVSMMRPTGSWVARWLRMRASERARGRGQGVRKHFEARRTYPHLPPPQCFQISLVARKMQNAHYCPECTRFPCRAR